MEHTDTLHHPTGEDQAVKSQMEKLVDTYDAYMRKVTLGREHVLRGMTLSLAGVKPGESVLEVGCATGTLTLAAKRQVGESGRVFGIDVIPGMIEASQRKAAQANVDAAFQLGSIDDIPFPADQFDSVMCSFMIFHMSEAVRCRGIAEIYRVLKPGGRLIVLDFAMPTNPLPRAIVKLLFGRMMQHDLRELLPLMETSGFTDIEKAQVKFRVMGLQVLGFVRGSAQKNRDRRHPSGNCN
jgi:ubiquinone/menaquinone biosynthesis C-methylase UbiE